jgi:glycosyltransferase involved in cell wall biosynthesis
MANPTRKKIVFVNPRPVKGGDIAISVARNCPDIPFTFFQAWTLDSQVIELMKQAKSLRNVEWRSPVMDAKEIYKDAHTMLIPSRADETWGRIATEAHFNGIPVIASRRGGLVESVGPGGILLEPTASAEQWTEATRNIWDDPKYYAELSQSALQFSCRHDISERAIMGQFMMVLEQVTAENSRVSGRHYVPHPS